MNLKFWYMKSLGFLMVIIGFMYSITSFYNFFEVVFGNKIMVQDANIWLMSIGLLFPLFVFVFGVFFYFYADLFSEKPSKWVLVSLVLMIIIAFFNILLSIFWDNSSWQSFVSISEFIHRSFGYVVLFLSIFLLWGKKRFKY